MRLQMRQSHLSTCAISLRYKDVDLLGSGTASAKRPVNCRFSGQIPGTSCPGILLHTREYSFDCPSLLRAQVQVCGELQYMHRAGIPVQFRRARQPHAAAIAIATELLIGKTRDRAILLAGIRLRRRRSIPMLMTMLGGGGLDSETCHQQTCHHSQRCEFAPHRTHPFSSTSTNANSPSFGLMTLW